MIEWGATLAAMMENDSAECASAECHSDFVI
jgi:hypothetical protein